MEVSFFGGPRDGEADEVFELMPRLWVPVLDDAWLWAGTPPPVESSFSVAIYILNEDEDGPYYVCSDG